MSGVGQDGSDPRDLLRILRRRGWILLLCLVLVPSGIYAYSSQLPDVYESQVLVQAQGTGEDVLLDPNTPAPEQNTATVARLALTSAVATEAASILGEPPGSVSLSSTSVDENTGFITLVATGASASRAAEVANAFAQALGTTRTRRARRRLDEALPELRRQLAGVTMPVERQTLRDRIAQVRTLRRTQRENVQVIEPATVGVQVAPHPGRNAMLGLIAGGLLGLGLMLVAERFDRKLRKAEDLRTDGPPLLATLPKEAFSGSNGDLKDPLLADAFHALRDSLTYFNVDRELSSVAVTSALKGEGKTTVAINLALSLASAGRSVILVDCDLRSPQVGPRLQIKGAVGLSQVLAGAPLEEAMRQHNANLWVLPAGPSPPDPSQLLGSARMSSVLELLVGRSDIVVVDTSPLLVVSDAFPLLGQVAGVVALARLNQTPRPAIHRMLEIISTAAGEARLLGLVATGAGRTESYGYGYGYGYGYRTARSESR